jgi:LmbE family N-acetylglucosaminyl deacetylase
VVVSDGAGSHLASNAFPPERLRALRQEEARAAAAALGLDSRQLLFLNLPDRFVPSAGLEAEQAAALIAEQAHEAGARAMFVTWRHDPHCDHRAAYAITRLARRLLPGPRVFEYPIWGRSLPAQASVPEAPRGWRFDGRAQRVRKRDAIACHRSQTTNLIDDDPAAFRLDTTTLARFDRDDEIFLELDT